MTNTDRRPWSDSPSPAINVYGEIPADIPPDHLQSVLSYFGIHETFDQNGNRKWALSIKRDASVGLQQECVFEQSTRSWTLRDQYVATDVLSNPPASPSTATPRPLKAPLHDQDERDPESSSSTFDSPDWVCTLPKTKHIDFFRRLDWSSTPLGSLETWPRSLRFYTHMVLSQKTPAAVYWGLDHISIYNEGFVPLIGKTHPAFMGSAFLEVWQELKSSFEAIFAQVRSTGMGIDLSDYNLFLERNNYTEETWWRGNLFPLAQEDGTVGGCCFMWNEVTRQVLYDRRTRLLNQLAQFEGDGDSIWEHIRTSLRRNPRDIAMAVLYSCDETEGKTDRILRLEGAVGIDTNHIAAPTELDLERSESGFAPALRKALAARDGWIAIRRETENFPVEVLEGIDWQGYGESSQDLVVMPLELVGNLLKGFVILGMNPRRAFDADHRKFVSDIHRQLLKIMNSVTTAEQARERESKLTQSLADSERRIRLLAELAPMGLFDLSAEGKMRWANNHYFTVMGLERPKNIADTLWKDPVDPVDLTNVENIFRDCIENGKEMSGTVRLNRKWHPPNSEIGKQSPTGENVHIYFQAVSYKENGVVTSIMGSTTDISSFVWAESVQADLAEHARRSQQRQEEFIDIVSHELRNPLSAVTQCADGLTQSLQELKSTECQTESHQIIDSCLDATDSILLCAGHQKRVVDDVLTVSKLDSDLITLAPTPFQPSALQEEALQMFRAEFSANDIKVKVEPEDDPISSTSAVIGDPARTSQVLVNLVTNAIKFQKPGASRKIELRYGVCRTRPGESKFGRNFQWSTTSGREYPDATNKESYGDGEIGYLYFSLSDNGQGLPSDKAVMIFDKFNQASRRTHIKYGGSGLGLYISRQLTEMQGGHIGVDSENGVGSTFAFYVKVRAVPAEKPSTPLTLRPKPSTNSIEANFEILLVEDNVVNQKVLTKQLRKAGCTVHVANHGGEAVDYILAISGSPLEYGTPSVASSTATLETVRLDCVLMDWEMPVLDGLAATGRIRELEKQGIISVRNLILGVTANARSEQITTAMKAGMDDVVTKPFRVPTLTAKIHNLLRDKKDTDLKAEE